MPFRPSLESVTARFIYHPESGLFTHKNAAGRHGKYPPGSPAGGSSLNGIVMLNIDGKYAQAHQVAHLMTVGVWPAETMRHANGDKADNRWENLRVDPPGSKRVHAALTLERVKHCLAYDPDTGALTWRTSPRQRTKAGDAAGTKGSSGYLSVTVDDHKVKAHRLAWALYHGEWLQSGMDLDHINGVRHDNRIENLRRATRSQNAQNAALRSDNKTGVTGVFFRKETGKFQASIQANGKGRNLGAFATLAEAQAARLSAVTELHPFHNPNRH